MKKVINILSALSIVAVILLIILEILWNGKTPKMTFVFEWSAGVLFVFAIPLLFGWFSLAVNKNKFKPQIWLTIYGVAILLYCIVAISFGFLNMTKDLFLAGREEYTVVDGKPHTTKIDKSTQVVTVQGITFNVMRNTFNVVEKEGVYHFVYLPNTKYLIDIIDENGVSLQKDKKP